MVGSCMSGIRAFVQRLSRGQHCPPGTILLPHSNRAGTTDIERAENWECSGQPLTMKNYPTCISHDLPMFCQPFQQAKKINLFLIPGDCPLTVFHIHV